MAPGFRGQSTRKPAGPTVEGEAPPGADEASLFRGWPPVFGGKAHGNRLGRRWKAKRRRGRMKRACFEDGPQTADMQYPLFGLGRRWKAKRRRGRKDFFDTLKQLSQTGTARSAAAAHKTGFEKQILWQLPDKIAEQRSIGSTSFTAIKTS